GESVDIAGEVGIGVDALDHLPGGEALGNDHLMLDGRALGQLTDDVEHRGMGSNIELTGAQAVAAAQQTRAVVENIGVGDETLLLEPLGHRTEDVAGLDHETAVLGDRAIGVEDRGAIDKDAGDTKQNEKDESEKPVERFEETILRTAAVFFPAVGHAVERIPYVTGSYGARIPAKT